MNRYTLEIVENWNDMENKRLNKHVFIDKDALAKVAGEHAKDDFEIPKWREPVYAKHAWAFAAQELFANCFNAHYNDFAKPDTKYTVAIVRLKQNVAFLI